jgi:CDGSH-type Zn-finger protein
VRLAVLVRLAMPGYAARVDDRPRIRVLRDGPYEVIGLPLARTAQVETEYGEPVDWEPLEPLEVGARYRLCRCGNSSTKPFCDDTHDEGFDGTEVADRAPRSTRATVWAGDGVVMTDDFSLCTHAGYCGDRFTRVWEMIDETADPVIRERLQRMVSLCPSGRLAYAPAEGEPDVEPAFEPHVALCRDGPILVRGGIAVESEDGQSYEVRNRVTLCRCGHSSNKPFCDGTHGRIRFREG